MTNGFVKNEPISPNYVYVYIKYDNKWYNEGFFTIEGLDQQLAQFTSTFGTDNVFYSPNPDEEKNLNRKEKDKNRVIGT